MPNFINGRMKVAKKTMTKRTRAMYIFMSVVLSICLQILFPCKVYADTEAYKCVLGPFMQGVEVGTGMNVSGKSLYGCIFVGVTIDRAVFDDCDFYGAQICQCDFRNASFKRANLGGSRLGDCKFEGADFTDAIISDIERYDRRHGHDYWLTYEQLTSTYSYKEKILSNTYVQLVSGGRKLIPFQLDFRGADLRGAVFAHCDVSNYDFTDAQIEGMVVRNERFSINQLMSTSDFKQRMLIGVELPINKSELKIDFSKFHFWRSKLRFILSPNNNLTDAEFLNCTLIGGQAKGILNQTRNYKRGDLSSNTFVGVDFCKTDLSRQNLTGCVFSECNFTDVLFDDAVITNAHFFHSSKYPNGDPTLHQIKSTWNYKNNRMEGITLPKDISTALEMERKAKNKSVEKDE